VTFSGTFMSILRMRAAFLAGPSRAFLAGPSWMRWRRFLPASTAGGICGPPPCTLACHLARNALRKVWASRRD
jgi:hypothetical protein